MVRILPTSGLRDADVGQLQSLLLQPEVPGSQLEEAQVDCKKMHKSMINNLTKLID